MQERYRRFASEGLGGASAVVGGSSYMIEEAASVIPGWRERATVVNPGCDVELFTPRVRPAGPDASPRIAYVGKLLPAKGVHHFLAAMPLVEGVGLSALVIGDGSFEAGLRALWGALASGNARDALEIAETDPEQPLHHLAAFLNSPPASAAYYARASKVELSFTGYLDHAALSTVLPELDVLVVPSVVPEAFGMVAAEAAACGVLPVVADHSGLGEVGRILEAELGRPGLLTFSPAAPVDGIASAVNRVLALPPGERAEMGRALSDLARRRWSWEGVAQSLLEVAAGR